MIRSHFEVGNDEKQEVDRVEIFENFDLEFGFVGFGVGDG